MKEIFSGLRILDFSSVLAGPSVTTFFAELGAEVIKIENLLQGGDVTRTWKLSSENPESSVSAYFSSVNYHKKYIWKDLRDASFRSELEEMIRQSDVVVVNFKEGDDVKFHLSAPELHAINKRLIYARIKGFDSDPSRVAYDVVLQAETGYMHMNGESDGPPLKMPVAMMDILAAHQLKEGILTALYLREKNGEGSEVEISLEKAGLSALVNQATNYLMAGFVPGRQGSLHPNIAPYGETFFCQDKKALVLAVGSDRQFRHLCEILGLPDLPDDARFADNQHRVKNRKVMAEILAAYFLKKERDSLMELFTEAKIPAGAIRPMNEVMENPIAQSMILEEEIEGQKTRRMATAAFSIR